MVYTKNNTYDPFNSYGSGINFAKDAAAIAAASLVGCLYGATAGAILLATTGLSAVVGTFALVANTARKIGHDISKGSPTGVVTTFVSGSVTGILAVAVLTALAALIVAVTPLMVVASAVTSAQHAAANPKAGLLERIFGSFKKVSSSTKEMRQKINENSFKSWMGGPSREVN